MGCRKRDNERCRSHCDACADGIEFPELPRAASHQIEECLHGADVLAASPWAWLRLESSGARNEAPPWRQEKARFGSVAPDHRWRSARGGNVSVNVLLRGIYTLTNPFEDEDGTFCVLINDEGQYSLWPTSLLIPCGWTAVGPQGHRRRCLAWIEENWSDMRPKSIIAREAAASIHPDDQPGEPVIGLTSD
jgi:MbtH protein